jgi:hypothetical protein
MIRKLLLITLASLAPLVPAGATAASSDGIGSGHETIRPFQRITCHLPFRLSRHRTYLTSVEAFVDPDPQFIHSGR